MSKASLVGGTAQGLCISGGQGDEPRVFSGEGQHLASQSSQEKCPRGRRVTRVPVFKGAGHHRRPGSERTALTRDGGAPPQGLYTDIDLAPLPSVRLPMLFHSLVAGPGEPTGGDYYECDVRPTDAACVPRSGSLMQPREERETEEKKDDDDGEGGRLGEGGRKRR